MSENVDDLEHHSPNDSQPSQPEASMGPPKLKRKAETHFGDEDAEMEDVSADHVVLLTDTKTDKDVPFIRGWNGKAEPPPPLVRRNLWRRCFARANAEMENEKREVMVARRSRSDSPASKDDLEIAKYAEEKAAAGETYDQAVLMLLQDLITAHIPVKKDGEEVDDSAMTREMREKRDRKLTLIDTRQNLTDEFFSWMRDRGYDVETMPDRDDAPGVWTWKPVGHTRDPVADRLWRRQTGRPEKDVLRPVTG